MRDLLHGLEGSDVRQRHGVVDLRVAAVLMTVLLLRGVPVMRRGRHGGRVGTRTRVARRRLAKDGLASRPRQMMRVRHRSDGSYGGRHGGRASDVLLWRPVAFAHVVARRWGSVCGPRTTTTLRNAVLSCNDICVGRVASEGRGFLLHAAAGAARVARLGWTRLLVWLQLVQTHQFVLKLLGMQREVSPVLDRRRPSSLSSLANLERSSHAAREFN